MVMYMCQPLFYTYTYKSRKPSRECVIYCGRLQISAQRPRVSGSASHNQHEAARKSAQRKFVHAAVKTQHQCAVCLSQLIGWCESCPIFGNWHVRAWTLHAFTSNDSHKRCGFMHWSNNGHVEWLGFCPSAAALLYTCRVTKLLLRCICTIVYMW